MGESKTMKRIRVLHSELNGELGGIESFLYNVYRFIDKDLDRNKDIKNHLFFVSFDSATVSLTVIRYLIEYAAFHSE